LVAVGVVMCGVIVAVRFAKIGSKRAQQGGIGCYVTDRSGIDALRGLVDEVRVLSQSIEQFRGQLHRVGLESLSSPCGFDEQAESSAMVKQLQRQQKEDRKQQDRVLSKQSVITSKPSLPMFPPSSFVLPSSSSLLFEATSLQRQH